MKKCLFTVILLFFLSAGIIAQNNYIRLPSVGISFVFLDFTTPERIRASSIRQVIQNDEWAGINEMSPGFAISYIKGLHQKIDFASTLTGSFGNNAKPRTTNGNNTFLVQADAVLQFKMLSDKHMFTPYLLGGIGASKLKSYYGAFMPVGGGFKVNFFDEAAFFIQAKYQLPVTTATINPHFVYGIGIAGIVGKKKEIL